jgi:hypothetical protein
MVFTQQVMGSATVQVAFRVENGIVRGEGVRLIKTASINKRVGRLWHTRAVAAP